MEDLTWLVRRALDEDIGTGDVTTLATVPEDLRSRATIIQRRPGVIYGFAAVEEVFRTLDPAVEVTRLVDEGVWREHGDVALIEGPARALLTGERTALNFLGHLSRRRHRRRDRRAHGGGYRSDRDRHAQDDAGDARAGEGRRAGGRRRATTAPGSTT